MTGTTAERPSGFIPVHSVRHPVLTALCTGLTGIKQETLGKALAFPDETQLRLDFSFHGVANPTPESLTPKNVFSAVQGRREHSGMSKAHSLCGLDDAKDIARLLVGRGWRALGEAKKYPQSQRSSIDGIRRAARLRHQVAAAPTDLALALKSALAQGRLSNGR